MTSISAAAATQKMPPPESAGNQPWVQRREPSQWRSTVRAEARLFTKGTEVRVPLRGRLAANHLFALRDAALAGHGTEMRTLLPGYPAVISALEDPVDTR